MKSLIFRQTTPDDRAALVDCLGRIFKIGPDDPFLSDALMSWKYWQPHPSWEGSRSYVLERGGIIVAHGAVWPIDILAPDGRRIRAIQLYDWAADPQQVGAGLSLLKNAAKLTDVICSIGGSEITDRMREPMGFRRRNVVHALARTIRPVADVISRGVSWKTPVRLARAWLRSWPLPNTAPGWDAVELTPAEVAKYLGPFPAPMNSEYVFEENAERLRFLSTCPTARFRFYAVRREGGLAGYFVLTHSGREARIAEAWIAAAEEPWNNLFSLAMRKALEDPHVTQIGAWAPIEAMRRALVSLGFHSAYEQPVYVYDPRKCLPDDAVLSMQFIHTDYSFLP